ncbi:AraC family transcriptional regulator [Flavobacterium sp. HSC-61S13]|uniref:AraC family transcriptional regulator n=1 Tax=Flavobacterium sp. HSC-61S13 TaxID=2910963 RepID=UPI00209ECD93|nr:AraC family transcriptional regulator [Flavobacterium sp. HSC-61S13]MCP1995947.1 AraC-like DNA-binding protein [Flavobacterium sp. HSC-61S13]
MVTEDSLVILERLTKKSFVLHQNHWVFPDTFHDHPKGQLIFVEEGFQYLHLEDQVYLLPQNHAAWIPSSLPHKSSSTATNVYLRTLFYDCELTDDFYNHLQIFSVPQVLREMILYTEKWSMNTAVNQAEESFLSAILSELPSFAKNSLTLSIPLSSNENILGVVRYLYQYYQQTVSIDDLANDLHFSTRTLERLFKKETGLTMAKYLQLIRCIKAVELLSNTSLTVSEIAYQVGYKSVQSFSNSFYNLLGQRPHEFLKK